MTNHIVTKIQKCAQKLYKKDKDLFKGGLCERSLMFRLAHYLQEEFKNYFVDCEFNKLCFKENMSGNKMMPDPITGDLKRIFVDIIIHKRNSDLNDNCICLELKRTRRYMENDIHRLKIMTSADGFKHEDKEYVFNYDFGFFILLPKHEKGAEIHIVQNGEIKEVIRVQAINTNVRIPASAG